jgi:ankyrin repeat protein
MWTLMEAQQFTGLDGCEQAINKTENEGLTPLHLGCMSGNSRVVKRLLIKGADKLRKYNK